MVVQLDEKAATLGTDELIAFVRLSFNADREGYVQGTNRELSELVGLSVPRLKRALEGLFGRQMVSLGIDKVFIFGHEENIKFSDGEEPKVKKAEKENSIACVQHRSSVDDEVIQKIGDYYNKVMAGKTMPQIRGITPRRKAFVRNRIKEHGLKKVYDVIDNASQSAFLNGSGSRGFVADFEWIMRPNNFIKVLEGKYNGTRKQSTNQGAEQGYYQDTLDLVQRLNSERTRANNQ